MELKTPYIKANDIYCTLGSPWVPSSYIEEFINHLLLSYSKLSAHVEYDSTLKTWYISDKARYQGRLASTTTYGTKRMNAINIIEKMLNMQAPVVYDSKESPINGDNTIMVLNKEETVLASEKSKLIAGEFAKWIFDDEDRKKHLEEIYNRVFVTEPSRFIHDEDFKPVGINKEITLYPYQLYAAERIVKSPTMLLAHDVGAGKTYAMIVGGMELRRRGISKKNLYIVPNNIVWQWQMGFKLLYPQSKLLVVEPKVFTPGKRRDVIAEMRDGDYDAIIIAYSSLELIPVSVAFEHRLFQRKIEVLKQAELENPMALPRLYRKEEQLKRKLVKLEAELKNENKNDIFFGDLHVNTLFLDEAHNYKNISTDSKSTGFYGLNKAGSTKCHDMLMRVGSVLEENGRGVVFATGTPITNSVTDLFSMQTYLQSDELKSMDIDSFDNWIGTFGEPKTDFQIDVDANSYCMRTSFSAFHNLSELAAHFSHVADFHRLTDKKGLPHFEGYTDIKVERTTYQAAYVLRLSARADAVRRRLVSAEDDNLLKITTDGRKVALDMRLIEGYEFLETQPKVKAVAEEVYKVWLEGKDERLTQLVFCDISTPKEGFNIYSELKKLLMDKGIPEQEIAFAHDATTEKAKAEMMEKTENGDIRVLIGSTMKLGTGVNVQKRLRAVHHVDIPWRPSDMIQREGRILRQGNINPTVYIYRYITEGSFDAYSWQILEQKQRFINQLLSNNLTCQSNDDVDETVLSYAEIKALAIGNPEIKKRVDVYNEYCRISVLQKRSDEAKTEAETAMITLPSRISECRMSYNTHIMDAKIATHYKGTPKKEMVTILESVVNAECKSGVFNLPQYRGFSISLQKQEDGRSFFNAKACGSYTISAGGSGEQMLASLDAFLDGLSQRASEDEEKLAFLQSEEEGAKNVISATQNYTKQMEALSNQLAEIDERLGIKHYAV